MTGFEEEGNKEEEGGWKEGGWEEGVQTGEALGTGFAS